MRRHAEIDIPGNPEVKIQNVHTYLDDEWVLRGLSLDVRPTEVTVLMGPSGAGKSTLVKHVTGLLEPHSGTVEVGGHDVWDLDRRQLLALRRKIGAMIGGSYLVSASTFGSLTVLENLTYTLEAANVPEGERHPRVLQMMRELDITEYHDRMPEQLPAHVTRRLALAKALILDAALTVLDEIDVGLDDHQAGLSVEALHRARQRTGGTFLVTTHNISLARAIADEVAVLVSGVIVAHGPPDDLLGNLVDTDDLAAMFTPRHELPD